MYHELLERLGYRFLHAAGTASQKASRELLGGYLS